MLVGGSGLYVRAALDDLDFPGTDPDLRARLEAELAAAGPATLHARLSPSGPGRGPRDPAVERAAAGPRAGGGRADRPAVRGDAAGAGRAVYDAVQVGLDRSDLDGRVGVPGGPDVGGRASSRRCGRWPAAGCGTARRRAGRSATSRCWRSLDGRYDEATARAETVRATRRFVRRQRSWFRRDPRVVWLDAARPDLAEAVLRRTLPG